MHRQVDQTSYAMELVSSSEDKDSWLFPHVLRVWSPQVLSPFSFKDKISCSPGWSQIHPVVEDDLEPLLFLPSAPEVSHVLGMTLGLYAC